MWSVWPERVDVYLGAGLVLVQRPRLPLWTFDPPRTLPLADVLEQVNEALNRKVGNPWRLRIHLSATLCLPVAFVVPAGVSRYREVLAIAQAHSALAWTVPGEPSPEVVCSLDFQHKGLAACMLASTHGVITRWASGHKGRLVELRPLWAVATGARLCRPEQVHCVSVLEPDALTVLEFKPQTDVQVKSQMGRFNTSEALSRSVDSEESQAEASQWNGVTMAFSRDPAQIAMSQAPTAWARHWSALS